MPISDFSTAAFNSFRSQDGTETPVELMQIRVPGFKVWRLANHDAAVTSQGIEYGACPYLLPEPNQDDKEPETQVTFPALDRDAGLALESTADDISVEWVLVLVSDPDTILERHWNYVLRDVKVNQLIVRGKLTQLQFAQEQRPPRTVTKQRFPGPWLAQS